MARKTWPLQHHRPVLEVVLTLAQGGQSQVRTLLADTGAGRANAGFELILDENDCLLCGSSYAHPLSLGGAYTGTFPIADFGLPSLLRRCGDPSPLWLGQLLHHGALTFRFRRRLSLLLLSISK